jgi:hypothetical protein
MKSRNCTMVRYSLLLLGPALMLLSVKAGTPQGAPERRGDADWTPTSVELRISARHQGAARFHVIDNGTTLQVGDEVRISMTAGELTYAYIFHRGSGGDWKLVFPNPEESGDPDARNPLLPGEVCSIPGENGRLVVDGVAGTEELVIYALAQPEGVLDDLAIRLRRGEHPRIQFDGLPADAVAPARQSAPVAAPEQKEGSALIEMPGLTFVPPPANGEARLPHNYALHLTYHNAGAIPASRIP